MKRHSTDRLVVAVAMSLVGALIAVLVGMPEAALFVVPWVVLCVLGMSPTDSAQITLRTEIVNDRLIAGDTVELETTVTTSSTVQVHVTPLPGASFLDASNPERGATSLTTVDCARAVTPAHITTELPASEWGAHDLGSSAIEVVPPYGLFRLKGGANERRTVRVHPTPMQLQQLLTPWMVRRVSGTHRSKESARGVEYADIREFGPGDSVRDINWRASARSGELWVSQRHPDRATDIVLLVDSFVETGHDVRTIFGLVVDSAVALAEGHLGATDRVGLIEFGGVVRWIPPGTGRVQLQRLTDALLSTGLYANAADKELPIMPPRALPPRSFVIAFTPLLDERFIDAIYAARARGHDVAVVECVPPGALQQMAASAEASAAEQLAVRLWHAERAMMRDKMAEQGIAVAAWDGEDHLDVTLGELTRRRRRAVRTGGR